jgi:DNA-binding transcriptional LysR family regulator
MFVFHRDELHAHTLFGATSLDSGTSGYLTCRRINSKSNLDGNHKLFSQPPGNQASGFNSATENRGISPMIPSLNIADIGAFTAVAEMKSIAKASARLHLSQSAITRRVQNLEDQLGVRLFDRDSRPMILTPEGQEAYKHAKNVLASTSELQAAITPSDKIEGAFRLGCSTSLGDTLLNFPLDTLRSQFPKLRLSVVCDESPGLVSRLRKRELDVVIILLPYGNSLPSGITGEMLCTDSIAVVVPKGFRFRRGAGLAELAEHPWIVNPLGCSSRQAIQNAFDKAGLQLDIVLETSGTGLQMTLIEGGRGLGVFLPFVVKASRFRGSIHLIRPSDFQARISMWIAYHPNSERLKQPIRTLRDSLTRREFATDRQ